MTTTLVLGGARSGKSQHAEDLLRRHEQVTYIATRTAPALDEDPYLTERIKGHQSRRPEGWATLETRDLTRALLSARNPVLIDGVSSWIRGQLDDNGLWDDAQGARGLIDGLSDELAVAARALPFEVVIVTQDVGWVSTDLDAQDRLFADLLGQVNVRLSAAATSVHAVIAGRVLDLSKAPLIGR